MLKQVLDVMEALDSPRAGGEAFAELLRQVNPGIRPEVRGVTGESGSTDFVKVTIPGRTGRLGGMSAPTLGIIGRLGGIGARPAELGLVSDADGAIAALAAALKLAGMHRQGEAPEGDVICATHICSDAPVTPHHPVPFMGSPVSMEIKNAHEVDPAMGGILSIDTTRGNQILNHKGVAITGTVVQGWLLEPSEDLLRVLAWVTGRPPQVLALSMADITPYGNGVRHINSILQPSTATSAPVVGVAISSETVVPGSATGVCDEADIAQAARFAVEVAKGYGRGRVTFFDAGALSELKRRYGEMHHLQTLGNP
jgi:hypothetical protein